MKKRVLVPAVLVVLMVYAGWAWFAWQSPELHTLASEQSSTTRPASIAELGQFGDAFGAINALFASVTVMLVLATYLGQRAELKQLRAHFAEERRMETLKLLLEGFDKAVSNSRSGSAKGAALLAWATDQAVERLVSASFEDDKGAAWTKLLTSGDLADPKALAAVAECFRAMARCVAAAESDQERTTMLALIRGRVDESFGPALIVACASLFQGDRSALSDLDFVCRRLRHDFDEVYARMRLVHVTGKRPLGKYGTHYIDETDWKMWVDK